MKNLQTAITIIFVFFMATGCKDEYYTLDDYHSVNKIDTHFHYFADNNIGSELAKKDNFELISINLDCSGDCLTIPEQEAATIAQMKKYPDQIKWITAFTLQGFEAENWSKNVIDTLRKAFERGALGIKVWKNIGMEYKDSKGNFIMIDHPKIKPIIDFVEKSNKTVIAHIGEPKNCWMPLAEMTIAGDSSYFAENPKYHMYLHKEYPSYDDQINARDNFLAQHKNPRIIGAHLGSLEYDVTELAKRLDKFPNFGVDMAARISHLQLQSSKNREKVRDFMIKYQDRITYATDSEIETKTNFEKVENEIHNVWLNDWKYFATDAKMTSKEFKGGFEGLQLPKTVIDKIFRINAEKYLNLESKK